MKKVRLKKHECQIFIHIDICKTCKLCDFDEIKIVSNLKKGNYENNRI